MANQTKEEFLAKPWMLYASIMFAGFCGACLRYVCLNLPLPSLGGFPLATLLINVVGSFLIFVVFQHAGRRWHLAPRLINVINTGFLGAFTTLSAVCTDTIVMVTTGKYLMAIAYVGATFVLTFLAVLLAVRTCDGLAWMRMKRLQAHRAKHRAQLTEHKGGEDQ